MKIYILQIFLLLSFPFAFATHRIYFGTDYTYQDFQENFFERIKGKRGDFFKSYQLGYDYEKTNAFYLGGDIKQNKQKPEEKTHDVKYISNSNFKNYEGRIGLTFAFSNFANITPFIGGGRHSWKRKKIPLEFDKIKYDWQYFAYGLRLNLFVKNGISFSCYFKIMQMLKGKAKLYLNNMKMQSEIYQGSLHYNFDLKKKFQYLVEFPIRLYLPTFRPFDLSFVPFISQYKLDDKNTSALFNNKILNPENKTYDKGIRVEIGLSM